MTWAIREKGYSQRRACGLIGMEPKTYRYALSQPEDGRLRTRLRALAAERRRVGYRRLQSCYDVKACPSITRSSSGFIAKRS